jgi:hypothetical protein
MLFINWVKEAEENKKPYNNLLLVDGSFEIHMVVTPLASEWGK